jgi:hypothetical protein
VLIEAVRRRYPNATEIVYKLGWARLARNGRGKRTNPWAKFA